MRFRCRQFFAARFNRPSFGVLRYETGSFSPQPVEPAGSRAARGPILATNWATCRSLLAPTVPLFAGGRGFGI